MSQAVDAAELLKQYGISPTYQRLQVLKYLQEHHVHPRAEDVFAHMQLAEPPLSRATVYNVLRLFTQKGLLREMRVDGTSVRYDIDQHPHAHFQCDTCGEIFNVQASLPALSQEELPGFLVTDRQLYLRGVCPACQAGR